MSGLGDEWVTPPVIGDAKAGGEAEVRVPLSARFAGEAADAAQEAGYLLGHAASVMGLVGELVRAGALDPSDPRLGSLGEVCERGFRDMANREGEVLDRLGREMREALAGHLEDQRAAELRRGRGRAGHAAQP